jgi:hypothetical protein
MQKDIVLTGKKFPGKKYGSYRVEDPSGTIATK